jgi:hypothetical protein
MDLELLLYGGLAALDVLSATLVLVPLVVSRGGGVTQWSGVLWWVKKLYLRDKVT